LLAAIRVWSGRRAVIDGHCHLLPPHLREVGSPAWRDPWFAACHGGERPHFASGEDVVRALDQAGMKQAVVFGWPFADPGLLREANDYTASEVKRQGDRLIGFATVNPSQATTAAELQRCQGMGLVGVGELNCDAQGFALAWEGGLRSLCKRCEEMGWPVLLHASEPVGHLYPGKGTATPGRLWRLLQPLVQAAPGLRLCLAHLGGGLPFYGHMPEVKELCQRLWFDTAAVPFLYTPGALRMVQELLGPGRICFGSDFPLLNQDRYRSHLEAMSEPASEWLGPSTRAWLGLV
jgi:predicted TIM-barrel fold metal-dependent hydrolase